MICMHEIWEMDTALVDGMCPLCLAADNARLRVVLSEVLNGYLDTEYYESSIVRRAKAALGQPAAPDAETDKRSAAKE